MATDATVKVPGVGPEKKSTVMLFAAAGVGVIIYAMMARKKAAAAAAAAAPGAGTFTDPAGAVCAAPNPATGYCPGTPADTAAQQQLAAGSSAYGLSGGSQGTGSYLGSIGSLGGQSLSNAVPVFTNNGAWGAYVEQMLGSSGSDAIAAAVAKYLSGQSLTTDQATVAEEAVAIANYPPVSGPGGFPPSMNTTAGPAPAPAPVPAPAPTPAPAPGSGRLGTPGGIHLRWASGGSGSVGWNPVPGAGSYVFQLKHGGSNGTPVSGPFYVSGPSASFGPGIPKGQCTALIWPSDPADKGGPGSNEPHAEFSFNMP